MASPATDNPTLADAMRLILAQGRQIEALARQVKALEQRLNPVPGGRRGRTKLPHAVWLAQRQALAENARKKRLAKLRKTPKSGGKGKRRRKKKS